MVILGCDKSNAQELIPIEADRSTFWTIDDEYAAIADKVPAFAGLYLKKSELFIVTTDMTKKNDIISALSWVQKNGYALDPSINLNKAHFTEGKFNYRQLKNTFDTLLANIPFDDWGSIDIDEKLNRVEFGLVSLDVVTKYKNWIKSLNQPLDMIVFKEGREVRYYNDLSMKVRPTLSGLRINSGMGNCTLGLNAQFISQHSISLYNQNINGFITASHCLPEMGKVTSTKVYQPERGLFGVNAVGIEHFDRSFMPPAGPPIVQGCPQLPDYLCRYSDAAFVKYSEGMSFLKGQIAKVSNYAAVLPDTSSSTDGIFPILPSPITFSGIVNNNQLMVGQIANKVGQKTGWTSGEIVDVCITLKGKRTVYNGAYQASNVGHLCSFVVEAGSSVGDSGASVWTNNSGTNKVAGILFGGGKTSLGTREFYASSIQFVFLELNNGYGQYIVN